jgi:hypothetical protein
MAKQVITLLTDDLDGSEADRTVEFGLDGISYAIDLSDKNIGKLRKVLEPYIAAGTRVGRGGLDGSGGARNGRANINARGNRDQNQAIRDWAAKNGYELSGRGRIPGSVVDAFNKAH